MKGVNYYILQMLEVVILVSIKHSMPSHSC